MQSNMVYSKEYLNPVSTGTELRLQKSHQMSQKGEKGVHRTSDRLKLKFKDEYSISN